MRGHRQCFIYVDGMVIIGQRSFESTFGAKKKASEKHEIQPQFSKKLIRKLITVTISVAIDISQNFILVTQYCHPDNAKLTPKCSTNQALTEDDFFMLHEVNSFLVDYHS